MKHVFWFFFSGSTDSSHRRTASVLLLLRVCWEIIWHLRVKWWLDGEGGKAENDGSEKEKRGRRVGVGGDQFSTPVSTMSLPVSTNLRIKLLRDLPELHYDRYSGNVYPDLTDMCHGVTLNTTHPSMSLSHTHHPHPVRIWTSHSLKKKRLVQAQMICFHKKTGFNVFVTATVSAAI